MALEYHEPRELLPPEVLDQHRAISSLIEELEAVIWYQERAAATGDPTIKAVLEHNRDEEIEHASMLMEWLRRHFPGFDEEMKTYLFTTAPIEQVEAVMQASGAEGPAPASAKTPPRPSDGSLGIGSLKK
ncbi:MAG: hypothetical protein JW709_02680 [Sedimentisphaerales bacterium]|nr:hypothetical protein [Sedimentisphaerales bacterium]